MDKTLARSLVSKVAPKPSERPSLAVRKAVRDSLAEGGTAVFT